jgi:hypothetical protein
MIELNQTTEPRKSLCRVRVCPTVHRGTQGAAREAAGKTKNKLKRKLCLFYF